MEPVHQVCMVIGPGSRRVFQGKPGDPQSTERSRAEQSGAEQSRAEQSRDKSNPFASLLMRLKACGLLSSPDPWHRARCTLKLLCEAGPVVQTMLHFRKQADLHCKQDSEGLRRQQA